MSHVSMFKKSDNEEGYIMIICHRERYKDELIKLGFVMSADELSDKSEVVEKEDKSFKSQPIKSKKNGKK